MTEKIGLFENLKLNKWYMYLLYIGGIILVLSLFLDVKIANSLTIIKFSFITIILGISLWIIDEIFYMIRSDYDGSKISSLEDSKRRQRKLTCFYYIIVFVILSIWLFFITSMGLF